MRLIHVTSKANLESIMENGLNPMLASMKRKAVWAVSPGNEAWAVNHTLAKKRAKGLSIHDHVVIVIEVNRKKLTRHARGVWYCFSTISPKCFKEVREASGIGQSYPG